jgi:predicted nucleic acid-binding protein
LARVTVVDASLIIALLDAGDAHHDRAVELLGDVAGPLDASTLTVAEVLVGPARAGRLAAARSALAALGLAAVPIEADAAPRLAELRAETGLKLPDCCVLLAAENVAAGAVLSFDDRLRRAADALGFGATSVS